MTKRKKSPTSGEGICSPKAPKTPRLGDSDGGSRSHAPPGLHDLQEAECRPASATAQSREQPGPAAASFLVGERAVTSRGHQGPPEKEDPPASSPLSQAVALQDQKGAGRFVPQFAKSRKTGTAAAMALRRPEGELEAPGDSSTLSLEKPSEPSVQQAGSQQLAGSGQEPQSLGEETQPDGTSPEQSDQGPVPSSQDAQPTVSLREEPWPLISPGPAQDPVPSSEDVQLTVSLREEPWPLISPGPAQDPVLSSEDAQPTVSLQEEPWPLISLGPAQDPVPSTPGSGEGLERGRPDPEGAQLLGDSHSQPGSPQSSEAEGGAALEGGTQGPAAGAALPQGPQEEEACVPSTLTSASISGPTSPQEAPSGAGGEAEGGLGSPGCSSQAAAVIVGAPSVTPPAPEQRALWVAGDATQSPTSPSSEAPAAGLSQALLRDTLGGAGEAGQEDDHDEILVGPRNVDPLIGEADSGHVASGVTLTQGLGSCLLAAESSGQGGQQDPEGLSLVLSTSSVPGGRVTAADAPQERSQSCPDSAVPALALATAALAPTLDPALTLGPVPALTPAPAPAAGPKLLPLAADAAAVQAAASWEASSAGELDFLPDSLIQDALDCPDLEALPEQGCPTVNKPGPCWPNPNSCAPGDAVAAATPPQRPRRPPEACVMQDASDTVRGLVLELSNLNRLIMSAHRDLDAFRRLQHRDAESQGSWARPCALRRPEGRGAPAAALERPVGQPFPKQQNRGPCRPGIHSWQGPLL